MIAAASFVGGTSADAATCALPVRYSATSDTTYLTAPGPVDTLTEIKAACPAAPLVQSSPGVWELNSDLVVQGGADAEPLGRCEGAAAAEPAQRPHQGRLRADRPVRDDQHERRDGDVVERDAGRTPISPCPAEAPAGARSSGRCRSWRAAPPASRRMDIVNSDLGFLGYNARRVLRRLLQGARLRGDHPGDLRRPRRARQSDRQHVPRQLHRHLHLGRQGA